MRIFAAIAACLMLAACFTSQAPLFAGPGKALLGKGAAAVTMHGGDEPDETEILTWTKDGYIDADENDRVILSFHRLPGSGPWSRWYVGQNRLLERDGEEDIIYTLFERVDDRLLVHDVSCKDLTDAEALAAHMARGDGKLECEATRKEDLGQALGLLAKRSTAKGYWTADGLK